MAGDWLKFEINTPEKREVLAISIELGYEDPDLTVGKLLRVWRWFDQHTVEGNAPSVSPALLDRLVGVSGMTQAMVNVGWMISSDDGLTLPNFSNHNGATAKKRALGAKRSANFASNREHVDQCLEGSNDKATHNKEKTNAPSVSDALAREEKRREDIKTNEGKPSLPKEGLSTRCPHSEILILWKTKLPFLTQPRSWEGARQANLKNRWIQASKPSDYSPEGYKTEEDGLRWWGSFFDYIAKDTKLANGFDNNGRTWKPTLEWAVNAANFQKIIDGNYNK